MAWASIPAVTNFEPRGSDGLQPGSRDGALSVADKNLTSSASLGLAQMRAANYFMTYKRVFDCLIEFTVPADEVMNETYHRIVR